VRVYFFYDCCLTGCVSTSTKNWKYRGFGVSFGKKEDMRCLNLGLFFVSLTIGWLSDADKVEG